MAKIRIKKRSNIITHEAGIDLNKDGSINDPTMNIQNSVISPTLSQTVNDPIKSALNRYQPSSVGGSQDALNTGQGYSRYKPFGDTYSKYKENTEWFFDPSDPFKREQLMNLFDPDADINKDPKRQAYLQEIFQKHPEVLTDPNKIFDLAMDSKEGPVHSLIREGQMSTRDPITNELHPSPLNADLAPMPKQPGKDEDPPATEKNSAYRIPWGNAADFLPYKGVYADPTTYSSGLLKASQADELNLVKEATAGIRGIMQGSANASGGSAAAQRQNAAAIALRGTEGIGNSFLNIDNQNNQAKLDVDRYNLTNQTNLAAQNTGILNQFDLENTQLKNDEKMYNLTGVKQGIKGIAGDFADQRAQNYKRGVINNMYDYNTEAQYQTPESILIGQNKAMSTKIKRPTFKYGGKISLK